MVMTIVPFNKRGRPWSDHGQFMVILWSTMVMDHDRPWSEHGRPWSDHDPAARVTKYSRKCSSFYFLIMSQDICETYKICLLIEPEVRDQGQKNNSVSVKVICCRNPFKIEQLHMA